MLTHRYLCSTEQRRRPHPWPVQHRQWRPSRSTFRQTRCSKGRVRGSMQFRIRHGGRFLHRKGSTSLWSREDTRSPEKNRRLRSKTLPISFKVSLQCSAWSHSATAPPYYLEPSHEWRFSRSNLQLQDCCELWSSCFKKEAFKFWFLLRPRTIY